MKDIPRRIRVDLMCRAELAIRKAIDIVEEMPPDTRLTDAVNLLAKAKDRVADYIDGV